MESLLAEFLPDLLVLFPPCRDCSFVLKVLIHPPDSDCSPHASSELLCRVSGLPWFTFQWEKQEMVVQSVPGLRLGSVLWKREKSQRPHCKQGRVWRGVEEAKGPGELILLCEENPKPCSGQRKEHVQDLRGQRDHDQKESLQRSRLAVHSKRDYRHRGQRKGFPLP